MRERGVTLVELLVSVTILALATIVALTVYDHARRSFKLGENVTEQQQVVRLALDNVAGDIRMAGFNTNPDGNRVRPDEQIEAAYDTAITLRADFDADDPVDADLPEQSLGGTGAAFLAVSTGNDEIVSYVLAKSDGSSTETLSFGADVGGTVRDGSIETVSIGAVDLTQDDPPYTLYKLVLENDSSGCCGTSFARRIPVADNVRSLRFRYFDRAGNELVAPGGDESPAAIATRSAIHRIGIEIEALTRDSDPNWHDANDPDPDTYRFRKFHLSGEVTPPNLGRGAIKDLRSDLTAPGAPSTPWLYPGHCGGLLVAWNANPPQDDVAYYRVVYGTDPGTMNDVRSSKLPGVYLAGLDHATGYHVAVEAVDAAGNRSSASSIASTSTTNTNTPRPVLSLDALGGYGQVDLDWSQTAENTADTTGDPATPMIRDLAGYRVYRSETPGFAPSATSLVADESAVLPLASPVFADNTVPACRPYYYKVSAVDACGLEGQPSNEVSAQSWTDVDPIAPMDVQAFLSGPDEVTVTWSPVLEDVTGGVASVDTYKIYRSPFQPSNFDDPFSWTYHDTVTGATQYVDTVSIPDGDTVHYLIQAVDTCSPPNESILSDANHPICQFTGNIVFTTPGYGDYVAGITPLRVEVHDMVAGAVIDQAELTFTSLSSGDMVGPTTIYGGSDWFVNNWDASPDGHPIGFFTPGSYDITAHITQTVSGQTCTAQATIRVHLDG